jgi:hypothetical protein
MSGHQEFGILAEQFIHLAPNLPRTVCQWQLRQEAALASDVSKIRSAGLLADQTSFEQHDRASTAPKEKRG